MLFLISKSFGISLRRNRTCDTSDRTGVLLVEVALLRQLWLSWRLLMYVVCLLARQTTRKKQLFDDRQPITTLFLLLLVTRSSQCCLTDIPRTNALNSSSEANRWPTWSPEYISVMTVRKGAVSGTGAR
ncbi:hypothetical protein BDV23DRAFT_149847 [Aspergillus alliaceus]|uniref:Uncharacterized protein n=1 Tax=Petromyces alliaceus TaxID=209559 RepID=A0A5N7CGF6_PETAA|nr:hypothetical protein BDV23DRAFT_149847 [Aspergillus alliaceus]